MDNSRSSMKPHRVGTLRDLELQYGLLAERLVALVDYLDLVFVIQTDGTVTVSQSDGESHED